MPCSISRPALAQSLLSLLCGFGVAVCSVAFSSTSQFLLGCFQVFPEVLWQHDSSAGLHHIVHVEFNLDDVSVKCSRLYLRYDVHKRKTYRHIQTYRHAFRFTHLCGSLRLAPIIPKLQTASVSIVTLCILSTMQYQQADRQQAHPFLPGGQR